ncbi:MAG: hypothetical protein IIA59_05480 [Candidatus Marinimicrobia bacterium]|nr:hypothetical protein [Candidatus Neomarinimicrobiota bacterium]
MRHLFSAKISGSSNLKAVAIVVALVITACTRQTWHPWDVMAEVDQMSAGSLWPGFEPAQYPVVIYDGEASYLFRHPAPPGEFTELPNPPGVWYFSGQHATIRANASVDLAGVLTATYSVPAGRRVPVEEAASVIIHELFHVYQSAAFPQWSPNEATAFTLPDDDLKIIGLRRLETLALRQALGSGNEAQTRCWAALSIEWRAERYRLVSDEVATYERQIELKEGLADYLQRAAWPESDPGLPEGGYPPEEGRRRGYGTGRSTAQLLDRLDPDWKDRLSANPGLTLDELLSAAAGGATGACELDVALKQQIVSRAIADVAGMDRRRNALISEMAQRKGWTINITTPLSNRLWAQGFDPLNIDRLPGGQLLHNRWLQLGHKGASLEVLGRDCLSLPAGEHPLLDGIKELRISGIGQKPVTAMLGDTLKVEAEGFSLWAVGAQWNVEGQQLTISLP